jgi:hypothetical protein
MSNAERQREFCKRNPGYYARRKPRYKATVTMAMLTQAIPVETVTPTETEPQQLAMSSAPTGC